MDRFVLAALGVALVVLACGSSSNSDPPKCPDGSPAALYDYPPFQPGGPDLTVGKCCALVAPGVRGEPCTIVESPCPNGSQPEIDQVTVTDMTGAKQTVQVTVCCNATGTECIAPDGGFYARH